MEYVIKKNGVRLSGFYPNDLPIKRYNLKKNCFTISAKNIFSFSNNNYMIFHSFEEAKSYLLYALHAIHESAESYNTVDFAGDETGLNIWKKLKIFED